MQWRRFLWTGFGLILLAVPGCAPGYQGYATPDWFAPNTPRPFPNPRPKPVWSVAREGAAGRITVREGDTVYALSRRYDISPRAIIDANDLSPPYTIFPGQRLRIPRPRYHVVRRGEAAYGISRQYGVDVTALMRRNDITPPYIIKPGQKLRLPVGTAPPRGGTTQVAKAKDRDPGAAASSGTASRGAVAPPSRAGSRFAWPVRGNILSRFGPKSGGRHNDGVNIKAPAGSPVRAAENGVVAYAGDDLAGFGNLILIRHQGGWVTAYAHNQALLVERGETVGRGQTIARVGATGSVTASQLHFEIRKGTRAVDPEGYL